MLFRSGESRNDENAARARRLFEIPVTWRERAGRVTVPERSEGETPKTSSSDGYAGTCRRRASGGARTSPGCSRNPMGAADLSRSAGSRIGERPWGAGSKRSGSPSRGGLKRVRGQRERELLRRSGNDVLRRGLGRPGTTAVGPGWIGSSALSGHGASVLVFLRVRGCGAPWTTVRSGRRETSRPRRPKGLRERKTPGAAADPASPRGRRGMKPSRR